MRKIKILFIELYVWQWLLIVIVPTLLVLPIERSKEVKYARDFVLNNAEVISAVGRINDIDFEKAILGARPGAEGVPSNEYTFYIWGEKYDARVVVYVEFMSYQKKHIEKIKIENIKVYN